MRGKSIPGDAVLPEGGFERTGEILGIFATGKIFLEASSVHHPVKKMERAEGIGVAPPDGKPAADHTNSPEDKPDEHHNAHRFAGPIDQAAYLCKHWNDPH